MLFILQFFMIKGTCASHPKVVHQYIYDDNAYACGGVSAEGGCNTFYSAPTNGFFTKVADYSAYTDLSCYSCLNGTYCREPPLRVDSLSNLFRSSCSNLEISGYTMGNGALAPGDVAAFWWSVYNEKVLSPASMKQWLDAKPLTQGTVPPAGTLYGLGVMVASCPVSIPLKAGERCGKYGAAKGAWMGAVQTTPICTCKKSKCTTSFIGVSHAGLDWGSGMTQVHSGPLLLFAEVISAAHPEVIAGGVLPSPRRRYLLRLQLFPRHERKGGRGK